MSQKMSLVQEPVEEGGPGHGCGHNLLGVGALGAAFALKRSIEEESKVGTVYLLAALLKRLSRQRVTWFAMATLIMLMLSSTGTLPT
jgi:hypothetical protein